MSAHAIEVADDSSQPTPTARTRDLMAVRRSQSLRMLADLRSRLGRVPGEVMREEAVRLGVSTKHLQRMLNEYARGGVIRNRSVASPHRLEVLNLWEAMREYFIAGGVASVAFENLQGTGALPEDMCLRTFQRRVNEWDPALRACAKGGYREMVKHQFFNREHIPHKAYVYGTDHTLLPVRVLPERGSRESKFAWLSLVMDLATRVVLSYKVTLEDPRTADNFDVLADAVDGWWTPSGAYVGGKPQFLRTDRGGDYISQALSLGLLTLGVARQFTEAYSSWQNGRVERIHGQVDRRMTTQLPGFHAGGSDEYSKRVLQTPLFEGALLTLAELDRRLGEELAEHNLHPHRSLGGLTPLQAWEQDSYVPERATHEEIVATMTTRGIRRLHHYGIEVRGSIYSSATLAQLRKANVRDVEVRFHDHDIEHIEVIVDGQFACTATRTQTQSEGQRLGVLSTRRQQQREAQSLMRAADHERVMRERDAQRDEGIDESQFPTPPPLPADSDKTPDDVAVDLTGVPTGDPSSPHRTATPLGAQPAPGQGNDSRIGDYLDIIADRMLGSNDPNTTEQERSA